MSYFGNIYDRRQQQNIPPQQNNMPRIDNPDAAVPAAAADDIDARIKKALAQKRMERMRATPGGALGTALGGMVNQGLGEKTGGAVNQILGGTALGAALGGGQGKGALIGGVLGGLTPLALQYLNNKGLFADDKDGSGG